jgi:NADPH:quinone reductase-like Zn-dependent oxidoreductase
MKAAVVLEPGKNPTYGEFREPTAEDGEVRIAVSAASLNHVTRGRAAGVHYSSKGGVPAIAGFDGVGRLPDGRRVYFVLPEEPFGSMAQWAVVRTRQCIPLPDDLDDVTAAGIANPGMSSWAALKERAHLSKGETVLVNGATGTAGSLAVQIAKHLGAKKVIATGRDANALRGLKALGADVTISIAQPPEELEDTFKEQFGGDGVDVILDYLWGKSAEALIVAAAKAGKDAVPIRFVEIGSASGRDITLPSAALRSSALVLMGSGLGSIPFEGLIRAIGDLFQSAVPAHFQIETEAVPLQSVEAAWTKRDSKRRIVFTVA